MSNNTKTSISFSDLKGNGNIRIPAIQRDYAQGRRNPKVTKIRKKFIHSLALVVKGIRTNIKLDFVYGSERNNAFEPLDGQQRLTTLFLFHWMLGCNLSKEGTSVFSYDTRISTYDFCNMLVTFVAKDLIIDVITNNCRIATIKELIKTTSDDEEKKLIEQELNELTYDGKFKDIVPSVIIQSWSDFKYEWRFDPSIQSMLVMIDSIFEEMNFQINDSNEVEKIKNWGTYQNNLSNITFDILNIEDFGLSDELFVKMNARGKQLSEFDITKSTIESEIQMLQKEVSESGQPLASKRDEEDWRSHMDGKWIDLFWNFFAIDRIKEVSPDEDEEKRTKRHFKVAEEAENKFKLFLLRMIGLQLLIINPDEGVQLAAYNTSAENIDELLDLYQDSLVLERSQEHSTKIRIEKSRIIDFSSLISSINAILYKDEADDKIKDISQLLNKTANSDSGNQSVSYFELFTNDKVSNYNITIWYAICQFCLNYQYLRNNDYYDQLGNDAWLSNLTEWVKFIRNAVLFDNVNDRIDTRKAEIEALKSIDKLLETYKSFCTDSGATKRDPCKMVQFIYSLDNNRKSTDYPGLDNSAIEEECIKAKLKLSQEGLIWAKALEEAEQHPYLWGQIRCLLNWSQTNGNYDIKSFNLYSNGLKRILDTQENNRRKIYIYLLKKANYWKETNRLHVFHNKDRVISFKRYFRTKSDDAPDVYAPAIKDLLDAWGQKISLDEFLDKEMSTIIKGKKDWIWCIAQYPTIIDKSNDKMIFESKGHYLLSKGKTMNTHCYDPVLLFVKMFYEEKKGNLDNFLFGDSQDKNETRQNSIEFKTTNEKTIFVRWGERDGCYDVTIDGESLENVQASEMLEKIIPIIEGLSSD